MFDMHLDQINELSYLAKLSDREIRSDLNLNFIKDENDYTSNFTGAFRRNINTYSHTGLKATLMLLDSVQERRLGCDATIMVN